MAEAAHLELLSNGGAHWNKWRKDNPGVVPDLSGAELQESFLEGIDFSRANLTRTVLLGSDLRHADLRMCDLSLADLRFVDLRGAKLEGAAIATAKGVDAKNLRAAMRAPRRPSRRALAVLPVVLSGIAYAGYWHQTSEPAAASSAQATTAVPSVEATIGAPADPQGAIDEFLAAERLTRNAVSAVSMREGMLTLEIATRHLSQVDYLLAITSLCRSLSMRSGGPAEPSWTRVYVVNSNGDQGWVLDAPELCAQTTRRNAAELDGLILDRSRTIE